MKKHLLFAATAAIAVALVACKEPVTEYNLSVDKSELTFEYKDNEVQVINVTAENVEWEIASSNTWIHPEKSGNTVKVSVDDYDNDKERRDGKFVISSAVGDVPDITVTVIQNPKPVATLKAVPTVLEFNASGNEAKSVTVTAENVVWNVKPSDASAAWLHLEKREGSVEVTVDDNEEAEPRETKFLVTSDNESVADVEVTITQKRKEEVIVFSKAMNARHNGDSYGNGLENFTVQFEYITDPVTDTPYPTGYALILDFFSARPADLMNPDIAPGDYTVGATDAEFVVRVASSTVIVFDDGNEVSRREPQSGTVKLTKSGDNYKFEIDMMTVDIFYGSDYPLRAVYEGPIEITNQFLSNLQGDVVLPEMIGGFIDFWGEYNWGVASNYWAGRLWSDGITCDEENNLWGNGKYVDIEFYTGLDESTTILPAGTYPLSMSMEAGTSQKGYVDFLILGSWYLEMIEDSIQMEGAQLAPMASGTITVSYDEGIYTIVIDALDDLGHKITGSYTGTMKYTDKTSEMYSASDKAASGVPYLYTLSPRRVVTGKAAGGQSEY